MAQLECKNLCLGYEGKEILHDLSFQISSGEYLCIVGENGSGKSTLMKTILGLQAPLSGSVAFGDGLKGNEIGYLPQQTDVQRDFPASVWEVVLSGCCGRQGMRPFYSREDKLLAEENIKKMELTNLKKDATGSFPEASSREFCWHERCAQRGKYSFWMNRYRAWTQWLRHLCIV